MEQTVVTGIGIVSPIGMNRNEVLESLINSKSGIDEITEMDLSSFRNNLGGVIKSFQKRTTLNGFRSNILTTIAAEEAIQDSLILEQNHFDRNRVAVSVGTSIGGYGGFVDKLYLDNTKISNNKQFQLNPCSRVNEIGDIIRNIPFSLMSHEIARRYGFGGPIGASVTACSASANALIHGRDLINSGRVDAAVILGIDPITQLTLLGFNSLMAMTKDELKVMDENRSGLLIGEGAGCIVLESKEHALKRKANIYAELTGCGVSNDAFHSTRPHPDAVGAILAIKNALNEAKLNPIDIDYINLHGTGTKHNDMTELKAVEQVFGNEGKIPMSSSKSMTGHTLGAAGLIESIISILSMRNNIIPPNLNFSNKIKGFNYDIVKETRHNVRLKHVLSNSFGFGGNCASLIFSEFNNEPI
ncbi:beta-ketoacyl-[acyl-carrier-protein] synthase family protein [Maribacter sp. M208]|uniref:beta-ketoacyl-[acyl-carrier-protein] synthase family protein n=1 Tax=Maribacter huludaoensis TaxID=3030010 RepID=UPI0023EC062C|nr:beta-ketoacyl-[acyl-carrier-protein] synthase family protein [Maribacter huludaoensis]MDF4221057.1 beta-ketoacyl-[acyl-carrier-protein] synthase family protein [Maribacter huludaoensis]